MLLCSLTFCGFIFISSLLNYLYVGTGPDVKSPDCVLFRNMISKELVWHRLRQTSIYKAYSCHKPQLYLKLHPTSNDLWKSVPEGRLFRVVEHPKHLKQHYSLQKFHAYKQENKGRHMQAGLVLTLLCV